MNAALRHTRLDTPYWVGRAPRSTRRREIARILVFALSQTGMVAYWWRRRGTGWRRSIMFNALRAVPSAIVPTVAATTKFTDGPWVIVIAIPLQVGVSASIGRHRVVLAATELHPLAAAGTRRVSVPHTTPARTQVDRQAGSDPEAEKSPALAHLTIVPFTRSV